MTAALCLVVPPELVDGIAERAAILVLERLRAEGIGQPEPSPWLDGAEAAAAYLGWPVGRVQKLTAAGALPHRKVGQRNSYRRDELDDWMDEHYEGPPRGLAPLRSVG